tara:strand:+ start:114 stop:449 length:336 start_codon:yes stop_codon:yes gene_type:complete
MSNNLICTNCKAGFMCSCTCNIRKTKRIKHRATKSTESLKENIVHPDHYLKSSGHEVIDVINAWSLNFSLGNAIKYIARAGRKDPQKEIEDLEKAKFYIDMQIEKIKNRLI